MACAALIKFTQNSVVGTAGKVYIGTVANGAVTCANDNDFQVASWTWRLKDVPRGSALVPGVLATTATATFTPDVKGSYRIELSVVGTDGSVASHTLNFTVKSNLGWMYAAFLNSSSEANAKSDGSTNTRGWAEWLDEIFSYVENFLDGSDATWGTSSGQQMQTVRRTTTTNNTTVTIYSFTLADNTVTKVDASIVARDASGNAASFDVSQRYSRHSGTVTDMGSNVNFDSVGTNSGNPPSGYSVAIDTSSSTCRIRVTGPSGSVSWSCIARIQTY